MPDIFSIASAVPWELIIFNPVGFAFFLSFWVCFVFILVIFWKTPAFTFLKASLGKKLLLAIPNENRFWDFMIAKPSGGLGYVKKKGYYVIDSKDVFIEHGSKIPIALCYGIYGMTIAPGSTKYAEQLERKGIKNYKSLMAFMKLKQDQFQEFIKALGTLDDKTKQKKINDWLDKNWTLNILGETCSFDKVIDYFNRNEHADYTEAEIQRRNATTILARLPKGPGDVLKWIIAVGVLLILVAFAFAIIQQGGGQQVSAVASTVGRVITPVIQNNTGTVIT